MIRSLSIQISSTSGVGPQGELEVIFSRYDSIEAQRAEFQYAIRVPGFGEHADGTMAYGSDLRLGAGDGIDHVKAMVCLLDFLGSDGEKYAAQHRRSTNTTAEAVQHRTGDSYLFNEQTAEWAHELANELTYARDELAETSAEREQRIPETTLQDDALDRIALQLSGISWNADTVERIAAIVAATGRAIDEPESEPEPDADPRLSEPEERRSLTRRIWGDQWFVVQRRYTVSSSASHHSSMEVGFWGDVVSNGSEAGMRKQFEWGARGGVTDDGVSVPPLARTLEADERLVRVVKGRTAEVLDEQLFEPRRVIALHESSDGGRWLIRRYEGCGERLRAGIGELDAIQLNGVGLSPVYESDELDTLRDWLDGKPERVAQRERGMQGNVHSDDERA